MYYRRQWKRFRLSPIVMQESQRRFASKPNDAPPCYLLFVILLFTEGHEDNPCYLFIILFAEEHEDNFNDAPPY